MPCELGYCTICGKKIHTECASCGTKKLTDQYTEVEVEWTNGSKMRVGVCVECAVKNAHHEPHHKKTITKAHHDRWEKHGGKFDKEIVVA